ncbi:hypothetical protein [Anoxybacillus flavithermus]|uniref:hypothetical protein n=1 Tax=Anoxybacillus flavithermus TaxID=33934 RepID=UPI0007D8DB54|nr:hypothetical protein [Anoxybacillus flavithermus]MBE2941630.1 hypothetical protein [Anoxybacillus flavithermus]MBE2944307.1 hypothetical protein [Anoxybacillus flavithermus]MBE2952518.1 hypothetical protein [Anoxybacillus flavithermus]MBE2955198.1 hypothetical protein [Anoxybacillus flavithermus]MBE2960559.1 hypothetical protein [Anoxybacillus flavithermus]
MLKFEKEEMEYVNEDEGFISAILHLLGMFLGILNPFNLLFNPDQGLPYLIRLVSLIVFIIGIIILTH